MTSILNPVSSLIPLSWLALTDTESSSTSAIALGLLSNTEKLSRDRRDDIEKRSAMI